MPFVASAYGGSVPVVGTRGRRLRVRMLRRRVRMRWLARTSICIELRHWISVCSRRRNPRRGDQAEACARQLRGEHLYEDRSSNDLDLACVKL